MGRSYQRSHQRAYCDRIEAAPAYFVPAFSVRRSVRVDDTDYSDYLKQARKVLGKHFHMVAPPDSSVTIIEKSGFIKALRAAWQHPSPEEMRDLAYEVRDRLRCALTDVPETLALPLGRLGVYGYGNQRDHSVLGVAPAGWKGCRARIATRDQAGNVLPLGQVRTEIQLGQQTIDEAFADTIFDAESLIQNPHLSIGVNNGGIRKHELRRISERLEGVQPPSVSLGDPVIYLTTARGQEEPPILVREPTDLAQTG